MQLRISSSSRCTLFSFSRPCIPEALASQLFTCQNAPRRGMGHRSTYDRLGMLSSCAIQGSRRCIESEGRVHTSGGRYSWSMSAYLGSRWRSLASTDQPHICDFPCLKGGGSIRTCHSGKTCPCRPRGRYRTCHSEKLPSLRLGCRIDCKFYKSMMQTQFCTPGSAVEEAKLTCSCCTVFLWHWTYRICDFSLGLTLDGNVSHRDKVCNRKSRCKYCTSFSIAVGNACIQIMDQSDHCSIFPSYGWDNFKLIILTD